jgi:hypothetical protein
MVYPCMFHFSCHKWSSADQSCQQVLGPFLAASVVTFYLVSKMQEMDVRCTLYSFPLWPRMNGCYSGEVRQGSKKLKRCSDCKGGTSLEGNLASLRCVQSYLFQWADSLSDVFLQTFCVHLERDILNVGESMVQNTMFVTEIFRVNVMRDLQNSLREVTGALSRDDGHHSDQCVLFWNYWAKLIASLILSQSLSQLSLSCSSSQLGLTEVLLSQLKRSGTLLELSVRTMNLCSDLITLKDKIAQNMTPVLDLRRSHAKATPHKW